MDPLTRIRILEVWFQHHGGHLHPSIGLTHSPTSGFSLRTVCGALEPSSELSHSIVIAPLALSLSALDIDRARVDWPAALVTYFADAPEALCRFLLVEQHLRGSASFWAPYLATLPRPLTVGMGEGTADGWTEDVPWAERLHTPLWYGSSERACIEGTNLAAAALKLEEAWRAEFEAGMELMEASGCGLAQRPRGDVWSVTCSVAPLKLLNPVGCCTSGPQRSSPRGRSRALSSRDTPFPGAQAALWPIVRLQCNGARAPRPRSLC